MSEMWTNSEIHEFIDLYKTEPILWNPNHPLKRSRQEVTDAWIRIQKAFSLECPVAELKKKKESLMAGYRMKVHKKKIDENYRPSWFAYDQMASFLAEFYEADNDNSVTKHESDPVSIDATYFEEINDTSDIILDSTSAKKSRKRKIIDNGESFIEPEFVQFNDTDKKENKKKDVCDVFCQLLALKLRKLDEYDREVAMHEIDKIMFQAQIKKCRKLIKTEETKRRASASITQSEFDEEHISDD